MERKSSVKEVHKVIQKDISELHKTLSQKLGADNPFAKISIGSGYYSWSDTRRKWNQLISASDLEQNIVRDALLETKTRIAPLIGGNENAELLFTVPDDSYIYYNDDEGDVKILLAGWGFKKPVRISGGPDGGALKKNTPVSLSFSYDGELIPSYEFGIRIPSQIKKFKTDITGHYNFNNLTQKELFLKDFVTGKDFHLVVEEGRVEYDFDVTIHTNLFFNATENDEPLKGEAISVLYHGKSYVVTTNDNGTASIQLPFYQDEQVTATLRDKVQTEIVTTDNNRFEFAFEKIEEKSVSEIEVLVIENGNPIKDKSINIIYAGKQYYGLTNLQGKFTQTVEFVAGEVCKVSIPDFEPQSKALEESSVNTFYFEKKDVIEPSVEPEPIKFSPHILIEGDNGFVGSKYPISVTYNGIINDYVSDESGVVYLPELEEGKVMLVTDKLHPTNTEHYELKSEQEEYVFHVPYESTEGDGKIKVMLRNADGLPIKCDHVRFVQEDGTEVFATLDSDGDTYFSEDSFKEEVPIHVSILGADKTYEPFDFCLERNENEYLLQEKRVTWWLSLLLQILLVLASIAVAYLLWQFAKVLFASTFLGLYQ